MAFARDDARLLGRLIDGDIEQWSHTDSSCTKIETLRGVHGKETCRTLAYVVDGGRRVGAAEPTRA